jgi:hypothetical protein
VYCQKAIETNGPMRPLACRKCCAYCCHYDVDVNVLEAARLAELVQQMHESRREETIRRLEAAAEAYRQADSQPDRYRHPCPFLVDNAMLDLRRSAAQLS